MAALEHSNSQKYICGPRTQERVVPSPIANSQTIDSVSWKGQTLSINVINSLEVKGT